MVREQLNEEPVVTSGGRIAGARRFRLAQTWLVSLRGFTGHALPSSADPDCRLATVAARTATIARACHWRTARCRSQPARRAAAGGISAASRLLSHQRAAGHDHRRHGVPLSLPRAGKFQSDPLRHRRRPRRLRVAGSASRHPQGGMAGLVAFAGRAQAAAAAAAIHEGRSRESVGCTRAVSRPDYRIHGTNQPQTIGSAVFAGCFRLANADVIDLYARVPVGGKVVVRQRPSL